ncbi:hypothetical protein DXG01_011984 [Tephrocybe rancida]|nr:hypothetical protein DXG01_011984 [Tephrocybe rancida]
MPHIIPSPSKPTVDEIEKNTVVTFESVQEFLNGNQVIHQVLMFDEIATEKRIRWDHQTNLFLGVCREHGARTSLEFVSEQDMEELFQCVDDGEVHKAAELMNLHVRDDDITADKDWKHVFKHFRNLLLRTRGIVIMGFRVTPSIIRVHLQEAGCSAKHIHAVFNPDDAQDVKLAFDLLKDIWNLPPASGTHSPAFHSAQEALRVLSQLLYHTVFPYISKVDSPNSSFWIMLLGMDRLEELFGVLRTMIGTDANLDVLQLGDCITGTIEVLNILAKYPEIMERRYPSEERLLTDVLEARSLSDQSQVSSLGSCFEGDRWHLGADILAPMGKLLVNAPLDDDDIDESLDIVEALPLNHVHNSSESLQEGRLEIEDAIANEDGSVSTLNLQKVFGSFITIDGKQVSKSCALAMQSKYDKNEINNITHDTQSVDTLPLEILYEGMVSVSFQVLGLHPTTSDDDPTLQYDWCSVILSMEKTCTVPGWFVEPLDIEANLSITRRSFYLLKSSSLVAKSSILFKCLQSNLKKLTVIKHTRNFPYHESSGKACFLCNMGLEIDDIASGGIDVCPRCSPEYLFDLKLAQQIFAHIAAHVLYDKTIKREDEPCGLCLRDVLICKIYLKKGKGSKGGLTIDKSRSSCPMKSLKFSFAIATASTESSPCSNVPIQCPLCPKSAPAVFKYNWKAHFANAHPNAVYANYASTGSLTNFELKSEKRLWDNCKKILSKRVMKGKGLPPFEVSTAHSSGGALGLTSVPVTGDDIHKFDEEQIQRDEGGDEPKWESENEDRFEGSDPDDSKWGADKETNGKGGIKSEGRDAYEGGDDEGGDIEEESRKMDVGEGGCREEAEGQIDKEHGGEQGHTLTADTHAEALFEVQQSSIPDSLQIQQVDNIIVVLGSNLDGEEAHVESGHSRQKRKAPVAMGSLSECLCGENALVSEAVVTY